MTTSLSLILTTAERETLAIHEATITRGLQTFREVGAALMAIRDERLYRSDFDTFDEYAEVRWGFTRQRANQLVNAFAVSELISATTVAEINNEAQARELAPLLDDPEELREVWTETVARTEGKPTAAAIREVRREREPQDASGAPAVPARPVSVDAPAASAGLAAPEADAPVAAEVVGGELLPRVESPTTFPAWRSHVPEVVDEETCRRNSRDVGQSLATLWLALDPDPIRWVNDRWRPDAYTNRDLPRVRDVFTITGLRAMAKHLDAIADHLDANGGVL